MFKKFSGGSGKKDFVRSNFQIKVTKVRVVRDGQNLGIMQTFEARRVAQELGLDLVEVAPQAQPPVCQIMDYGKFMFEKSKKEKEKKSSHVKEKDVCFRYVIDDHDLETKANQVKKFLEKGIRVKLLVKFKARENAHKDQGFIAIKKCIQMVGDYAIVDKPPTLEGSTVVARLDVNKSRKGRTSDIQGSTESAIANSGANSTNQIGATASGSERLAS